MRPQDNAVFLCTTSSVVLVSSCAQSELVWSSPHRPPAFLLFCSVGSFCALFHQPKHTQFTDEHGEVCPANWTPGAATMKADPKESLVSVRGEVRVRGGKKMPTSRYSKKTSRYNLITPCPDGCVLRVTLCYAVCCVCCVLTPAGVLLQAGLSPTCGLACLAAPLLSVHMADHCLIESDTRVDRRKLRACAGQYSSLLQLMCLK